MSIVSSYYLRSRNAKLTTLFQWNQLDVSTSRDGAQWSQGGDLKKHQSLKASRAWTPLVDCIDWDQGPYCSVTELSFVPIQ